MIYRATRDKNTKKLYKDVQKMFKRLSAESIVTLLRTFTSSSVSRLIRFGSAEAGHL